MDDTPKSDAPSPEPAESSTTAKPKLVDSLIERAALTAVTMLRIAARLPA